MSAPQPGIFAVGARAHLHVELDCSAPTEAVLGALSEVRASVTTIGGVNLVVGLGPRLWAEVAPDEVPDGLTDFTAIVGPDSFTMPAAQHDLWLWFQGAGPDALFDAARAAARAFEGIARVAHELPAFAYGASQDLTGFEDGTENPPVDEAVGLVAIPEGRPGAGASVALLQRWVHDLAAFGALDDADAEQVIGRTRHGSVEIDEAERSPRAHISRVVLTDDEGEELEVFRRSVPWGGLAEHGLEFVAFSPDRARLQTMLERMAGIPDGVRDRLTEFSTPVAGAWYVVPSVDQMVALTPEG